MERLLQVERARVAEVLQAMKWSPLDDAYASAYALYPLVKRHADSENALARKPYGELSSKLASDLNLANHDDESNALFCSYQIRKWKRMRRKAEIRRQKAHDKLREAAEKKRLEEARIAQGPKKPTKTPKSFSLAAKGFAQRHVTAILLATMSILLGCCLFSMAACPGPNASHDSTSTNSVASSKPDKAKATKDASGNSSRTSENDAKSAQAKVPDPVDPDWPTRNATLLAVPESERYYNAYKHVGEYHRVVGPVASVKYAAQSNGQPTFIDIGKPYPSDERFVLVIWGEDMDAGLYEMVTAVKAGNAWLSVEGMIETYKGQPEIQTGRNSITYQYWTSDN